MKVRVDPAQTSDDAALAELYHGNHRLADGRLHPAPDQGAQTFVARTASRIVGMVIMTYFDDGIHQYGILHVLEVDEPRADYARQVTIALISACRAWLRERGADRLLAAPQLNSAIIVERARRMREIRAEEFASSPGPQPVEMPLRYVN